MMKHIIVIVSSDQSHAYTAIQINNYICLQITVNVKL